MQSDIIEYFYSAHSAFAYIGYRRLTEIAKRAGRRLVHRPMHLGPVIQAVGGKTWHDEDMTLASCLLIAAEELDFDADRFAHLILEAHWRDDADISDAALLASLAASAGVDTDALFERSVFGSPTYFVDGDMYYRQDHLEIMEHELGARVLTLMADRLRRGRGPDETRSAGASCRPTG